MPYYLLHQNMRTYGGGAGNRNWAYNGALPAPAVLPPGWGAKANTFFRLSSALKPALQTNSPVLVAGLTEVTNDGIVVTEVDRIGASLMGNGYLAEQKVVFCGRTSVGGKPEYVAMVFKTEAAFPRVTVIGVGRIVVVTRGQGSELRDDFQYALEANDEWCASCPRYASPDFRWIVYAILHVETGPVTVSACIGVAFLHNIYKLNERRIADQNLISMGKIADALRLIKGRARGAAPAHAAVHVYLGGDFNANPGPPLWCRADNMYFHPYSASPPVWLWGGGQGGQGTTWSGQLYDYWFSDIAPGSAPARLTPTGVPGPIASADSRTCDTQLSPPNGGFMSDHCATLLRII